MSVTDTSVVTDAVHFNTSTDTNAVTTAGKVCFTY